MSKDSDQDEQATELNQPIPNVLHRLVGAAVLVILAVVILPVILNGETGSVQNPPGLDQSTHNNAMSVAPSGSDFELGQRVDPHAANAAGEDDSTRLERKIYVSKIKTKPSPVTPAQVHSSEGSGLRLEVIGARTPAKQIDLPLPIARKEAFDRGYVVRIGTFAVKENADKIVQRLALAGFAVQTTPVEGGQRTVTRVWVGPYRDRVTAGRKRTQIEQTTNERGFIASYP